MSDSPSPRPASSLIATRIKPALGAGLLLAAFSILFVAANPTVGAKSEAAAKADAKPGAKKAGGKKQARSHIGHLRHVVLFKFKDDASKEQVKKIEKAFGQLKSKIPTIIDYEWGDTTISAEKLNDGFTHCFVVTFKDMAGLKTYMPHPAHKAFVALLKPSLDKVLVVDFVAKP